MRLVLRDVWNCGNVNFKRRSLDTPASCIDEYTDYAVNHYMNRTVVDEKDVPNHKARRCMAVHLQ